VIDGYERPKTLGEVVDFNGRHVLCLSFS